MQLEICSNREEGIRESQKGSEATQREKREVRRETREEWGWGSRERRLREGREVVVV